jgi:hypothetical protein
VEEFGYLTTFFETVVKGGRRELQVRRRKRFYTAMGIATIAEFLRFRVY